MYLTPLIGWLLVLASLLLLIGVYRLSRWITSRPELVGNAVGTIRAIATIRDFRKQRQHVPGTEFMRVPYTFTFRPYDNTHLTGNEYDLTEVIDVTGAKMAFEPHLFVPYASGKYFKIDSQRVLFAASHSPTILQKRILEQRSWLNKTARAFLEMHDEREDWFNLLRGAMIAMLIVGAIWSFANWAPSGLNDNYLVFDEIRNTSSGQNVVQIGKSLYDERPLAVWEDSPSRKTLVRAVVFSDPTYLGGGLVFFEADLNARGWYNVGAVASVSLGLKKGDKTIIRFANAMGTHPQQGHVPFQDLRWAITEQEADALLKAGFKFKD